MHRLSNAPCIVEPYGAYALNNGSTARSSGQDRKRTESLYQGDNIFKIADRVVEVAEKYGKTPAQIAVAWLFTVEGVVCPVVGVSKAAQLTDLVEATTIELEPEDVAYLEALYQPVENLLSIGTS